MWNVCTEMEGGGFRVMACVKNTKKKKKQRGSNSLVS